jgi:hypothetical protein
MQAGLLLGKLEQVVPDLNLADVKSGNPTLESAVTLVRQKQQGRNQPSAGESELKRNSKVNPEMQSGNEEATPVNSLVRPTRPASSPQSGNDEMTSGNDEMTSGNDEMTSVNPEMTSGNEEVTSVNPEITSMNDEMTSINDEIVSTTIPPQFGIVTERYTRMQEW